MSQPITNISEVFGSGINCGIKNLKLDLGYLFIPNCVGSAGVFTKNRFVAPCLTYTKENQKNNVLKALVVNSGNANAATGVQGYENAKKTAEVAATLLNLKPSEVAIASTGIIGKQLPIDKITTGLDSMLKEDTKLQKGELFAEAILTTDLTKKEVFLTKSIDGVSVTVAGVTKGSGMIAPNMATMLGFIVTDVSVSSTELQKILTSATEDSFNMVSVDTDTSTNDMVLAFSTGEKKLDLSNKENKNRFVALFLEACQTLAKMIARDGEGATRFIEVTVKNAADRKIAKKMALAIVNSPLVKTAICGADPNWGRVLMAAGKYPELGLVPEKAVLSFAGNEVYAAGKPLTIDRQAISNDMNKPEVSITLDLNLGRESAVAWGCDLTHRYIDINVDYT